MDKDSTIDELVQLFWGLYRNILASSQKLEICANFWWYNVD